MGKRTKKFGQGVVVGVVLLGGTWGGTVSGTWGSTSSRGGTRCGTSCDAQVVPKTATDWLRCFFIYRH